MAVLIKHTEPVFGVWKIEETSDELFSLLDIQSEYQPFLQHIKTEKRRREWLASRVLLNELTGTKLLIAYHEDGAPYLPDSDYHLSISHTNGYAAVLLQKQHAAGIDIEYYSDRILKIRSRFMSPEEDASVHPDHVIKHLLIYWCAKEALFKMIRQKDVDFIRHLHIEPFVYADCGQINACETRSQEALSYTLKYEVHSDFVLVYSVSADFGITK